MSTGDLVDLHCHFVPGVDDGAQSPEEALRYLRRYLDEGITRVAATPHLPGRLAGSTYQRRIEESFAALRSRVEAEIPALELSLAVELRLDGSGVEPSDPRLRLGGGRHVLVEFSMLRLPSDPVAPLERLVDAGYVPVLAHPERYAGVEARPGALEAVRELGVRLCLNAGSLLGRYGAEAERVARRLLSRGQADLVGSDHHARPGRDDSLGEVHRALARVGEEGERVARLLLSRNPGRALDDGEMDPVPPLDVARSSRMTAELAR